MDTGCEYAPRRVAVGGRRCCGQGVEPVVSLSHSVLAMAPACPGDVIMASVFARNVSAVRQVSDVRDLEPGLG